MNIEHLIQMANQIGTYFAADPDRTAACEGVADHLARFWEKRMRQQLYVYLDSDQVTADGALLPLVSEALRTYRARVLG